MANFDRFATIYDKYRPSFETLRAEALSKHSLDDGGGRTAVDLGTGTGVMAFVLAEHGYRVTGLDHSPRMLEQARKSAARRRAEVDFRVGSATGTGLVRASVDIVTASQSWHLFDGRRAFTECRRILKPGGVLLVTTYDWLPLPGSAARITEEVIREVNPDWADHGGTGSHDRLAPVAAELGFTSIRTHERRFEQRYTLDDWVGRIRTSSSGGAGLDTAQRRVLEDGMREKLSATFPDGDIVVTHVAWSMSARKAVAWRPARAHAMTGTAG
ncbi:class I SAM-dependent methyltransferase [Streptomyces sp. M92]|uniref:class I SAM-dependent methyltransferase n=1 Tax=Streptomyces sp. M92 TaxID=2944250 RepID=UPI00234B2EED|nr:class I SAM-dependent methyltransferase [Streptomyces sp. M92]WCN07397.1 methyltransferase domain-containing protein [Streptomyces sp. M92]